MRRGWHAALVVFSALLLVVLTGVGWAQQPAPPRQDPQAVSAPMGSWGMGPMMSGVPMTEDMDQMMQICGRMMNQMMSGSLPASPTPPPRGEGR